MTYRSVGSKTAGNKSGTKRILLMGNPNVGKSVIFSRLTGVHVIASNYPGTTVGYTQGFMKLGEEIAEVVDAVKLYALSIVEWCGV